MDPEKNRPDRHQGSCSFENQTSEKQTSSNIQNLKDKKEQTDCDIECQ